MKKTLYSKFLLGYLIFACFGFLVVATFVSSMTLEHLKRDKSEALYKEATLIANSYASDLYTNAISLDTVKKQLDSIDVFIDSTIWIINPSGRLILSTDAPLDINTEVVIECFDPTITVGSYYTIGTFFDSFDKEMLSVFATITTNY